MSVFVAFAGVTLRAEEVSLVGKNVYPRDPSILVKRDNETIATGADLGFPLVVRKQVGPQITIWVSKVRKEGLVERADVLTAAEAIPEYSKRLARNSDNLYLAFVLSLAWEDLGQVDQALTLISRVLQDHPHAIFYNRRGNLWQRKRDFKQAIRDYNESLKLDPNSSSCWFNRGLARSYLGQDDLAISDFDAVLRMSPLYASAHVARASSWKAKGNLDQAISDYTMALVLNPDEQIAWQERANLWYRKGEHLKAVADYHEALRLQSRQGASSNYLNRGLAWTKLGLYGMALDDFEQAVQLDPQNATALNNRGWIRATCPEKIYRNGSAALADARRACELSQWNNPYNLSTLGEACAQTGDYAAAIRWQEIAARLQQQQKPADTDFQSGSQARLACYRSRRPFREPRPGEIRTSDR